MNKILLIDGNSMLFRAYYSTMRHPMKTAAGVATNAVFGFARMLNLALRQLAPTHVLVAFDTGKKTFRHETFTDYKGTRPDLPEELKIQFPLVRDLISAMGLKFYELDGFEADDIIGSLTKQFQEYPIDVLTGDKDLFQLAQDQTTIWMMKTGTSQMDKFSPAEIYATYQLIPQQIIDLKGLMGDASDNIPGVKGIGEKTALNLLQQYPNIETIYQNLDNLSATVKQKLIAGEDLAYLSKDLATIKTDLTLDLKLDAFKFEIDYPALYQFYQAYEMNSLSKEIEDKLEVKASSLEFELVKTMPTSCLKQAGNAIFFDLDATDYFDLKLFGCALTDGQSVYYQNLADFTLDQAFLAYLTTPIEKLVFDAKQIYHLFSQLKLVAPNGLFDVNIAAYLTDNNLSNWNNLAAKYNLHFEQDNQPSLLDASGNPDLTSRKCFDLFNIAQTLKAELETKNLMKLYAEIEMPLAQVLFEMEQTGILIDIKALKEYAKSISAHLANLEQSIYALVQAPFNLNSPKQMAEVLFDELQLPQIKKRSTAIDVLEKLNPFHEIVPLLTEYRQYQKIFSTYADGLQKYIGVDQRIHTIYRQTLTQTGRLSSINPNLQNISVRSEIGREVRKAFMADEKSFLVSADYSQVELRVLAHIAQETKLIEAFLKNIDIHTQTASEIFHVPLKEVDEQMRRRAKAVNFGIVYGISDFGLAEQLNIPRLEAQNYIDRYFEGYPKIKAYMDNIVTQCEKQGYVETLFQRRREIPEIKDRNHLRREFGKRAAMNAPIQGTAADIIKIAMIAIVKELKQANYQTKLLLQVHDELIFNVPASELTVVTNLIKDKMEHAFLLKVPLLVEISHGKNWFEI